MEVYSFRREILIGETLRDRVLDMAEDVIDGQLSIYCLRTSTPRNGTIRA